MGNRTKLGPDGTRDRWRRLAFIAFVLFVLVAVLVLRILVSSPTGTEATTGDPGNSGAQETPDRHVLVIGIDGLEWEILTPLLARNEVPHLAPKQAR